MTSFVIGGFRSIYNSIKSYFTNNKETLKRARRDSVEEDEEDDIFASYQTLRKRPRWMSTPYPSSANMASGSRPTVTSNLSQPFTVPKKKSLNHATFEVKENGDDIVEVIDLENDNYRQIEGRPPLATLSVKPKVKMNHQDAASNQQTTPCGNSATPCGNGAIRRPSQSRGHVSERSQQHRGEHSVYNSFTSAQLRPSSSHRLTALDETFKMDDKMTYSKLLEGFHKSTWNTSRARQTPLHSPVFHRSTSCRTPTTEAHFAKFPVFSSLSVSRKAHNLRSKEMIDLTKDEDEKLPTSRPIHVTAKPYEGTASSDDEDIKIVGVNSLERSLSNNSIVSPQWIIDMQRKYSERERNNMRRVEEERVKKELYSKHNRRYVDAIDERILRHLKLTDVVLDDTEEVPTLPDLTNDMIAKVKAALKPQPQFEVLVDGFGMKIKRTDIQTLKGLNWLNDEIINFYMNLIIERGKPDNRLTVYAFNTFFYPKLLSQGYSSLRRWTKKVDIFSHQMILVPVHLGVHWCMAVIDFRDKTIRYFDSMGSQNDRCLLALRKYLTEESLDKKKVPYDVSGWKLENVKDIPQQMNGSDCGVFSCMFGEYLSRNAKITFSQRDMPYFRQKMVYEILTKKLLL